MFGLYGGNNTAEGINPVALWLSIFAKLGLIGARFWADANSDIERMAMIHTGRDCRDNRHTALAIVECPVN